MHVKKPSVYDMSCGAATINTLKILTVEMLCPVQLLSSKGTQSKWWHMSHLRFRSATEEQGSPPINEKRHN